MRWVPQPGPQTFLLVSPNEIQDIFYGGARGGGKTSCALGYIQNHIIRYGQYSKNILFRKTYDELDEVIEQADEIYNPMGVYLNKSRYVYRFPNGGFLKLRYLERDKDAGRYQGHAYTNIIFEEAGAWKNPFPLDQMKACLRSKKQGVRKLFLLTGNSGGPGNNWLRKRYVTPSEPFKPFLCTVDMLGTRVDFLRMFILAKLEDNPILTTNDPDYERRLYQSGPKWLVDAWLNANFDIVAGGALDDIFDTGVHVIEPFDIPDNWYIDRSFDWGSASPFSVLWFAESNGEDVKCNGKTLRFPKGTVFVIDEWYGADDQGNGLQMNSSEIAAGIMARDLKFHRVHPGPADTSIYDSIDGESIGDRMEAAGIYWVKANKGKGSRVSGLDAVRTVLENSIYNEKPGLFIVNICRNLIDHLGVLQRDPKNVNDVDTNGDDHDYDALKYRINTPKQMPIKGSTYKWK